MSKEPQNLAKLAYETGYQDFYGRKFRVSHFVLVPRPETEQLVDEALLLAGKPYLPGIKAPRRTLPERPTILDIGTGSGNLAITLKLELPEATVIGLDISEAALEIARANAMELKAKVKFQKSNLLLDYFGPEPDLIVANLPYVDRKWDWLDKEALSFEPKNALYAGRDGLEFILGLLIEINALHWSPKIILEADPCQHQALEEFAAILGYQVLKISGFAVLLARLS